jgi:HD-GYP domain-containing protein (c-di-GMP phosphodiesterase class II)
LQTRNTEFEIFNLSLPKGSLNDKERVEIESHVTHTFQYLQKIHWGKTYKDVPTIAYAHHEKLNGRGYPRKLPGVEIPIQSRMMTISDIFDALTATDRPYKKAVPAQRALDILGMEVKDGLLDNRLYKLFIDAKVFETTMPKRSS